MAQPDIVKGTYIDILVGDGATPENFIVLCGLTTRALTEQVNTTDDFIRDCADPEDVPVRVLNVTGRQWDITGNGLYNRSQAALIRSLVGKTKNYRFVISEPAADNIDSGYYAGPAMITNRQIGGGDTVKATGQIAIVSDGEWNWVDA